MRTRLLTCQPHKVRYDAQKMKILCILSQPLQVTNLPALALSDYPAGGKENYEHRKT